MMDVYHVRDTGVARKRQHAKGNGGAHKNIGNARKRHEHKP